MKKSLFYPVTFMILVTVFFTSILAFLNYSTADMIDFNESTKKREKLLYVFDIPVSDNDPKAIEEIFNQYITERVIDDKTIYIAKDRNETLGYAFTIDGNALWGSVKGFIGFSHDFKSILGVDFISHSETPGLGGRIDESWFKEQFRGISISKPHGDEYIIYNPSPNGNVDAIAGATLTSDAVRKFINDDIDEMLEWVKEGALNE